MLQFEQVGRGLQICCHCARDTITDKTGRIIGFWYWCKGYVQVIMLNHL